MYAYENPPVPGATRADYEAYRAEKKALGWSAKKIAAYWKLKKAGAIRKAQKKAAQVRAREKEQRARQRQRKKEEEHASKAEVQHLAVAEEFFQLVDGTFGEGSWLHDMVGAALMEEEFPGKVTLYLPRNPETHHAKYAEGSFTRKARDLFRRYPAVEFKIVYITPKKRQRKK